MTIPAAIAAEAAMTRQAVAMAVLKQNADMQQKIASMLAQSVESVPVSPSRGVHTDISV